MAQIKKLPSQEAALEAFYDEPVPVMLIKDNAKYKDDLTVTLNGTNYQIQRGVPVMLPERSSTRTMSVGFDMMSGAAVSARVTRSEPLQSI